MPVSKEHKGVQFSKLPPFSNIKEEDFSDEKNSKFLFCRGFLICKQTGVKITPYFSSQKLNNNYTLYLHTMISETHAKCENKTIYVLGLAYFSNEKYISDLSVAESLSNELKKSRTDFLNTLDFMGGRYVILIVDNENIEVFGDTCGARAVFYSNKSECFGSHLELVNLVAKADFSEIEKTSIENKYHYSYAYPGHFTKFDGIYFLIPNFSINTKDFKQTRFFPREKVSKKNNLLEIKNDVFKVFKTEMAEIQKHHDKIALSLTAGLDSRVTFHATKELSDKITYFTEDRDIDIPMVKTLAEEYNLKWIGSDSKDIIFLDGSVYDNYNKIVKDKVFPIGAQKTLYTQFWNMNMFGVDNGWIHINSQYAEISRGRNNGAGLDGFGFSDSKTYNFDMFVECYLQSTYNFLSKEKQESQKKSMLNNSIIMNSLKEYYNLLGLEKYISLGYNPWDLLYWEQRCGKFLSISHMPSDPVFESTSLSNCREAILAMLQVEDKYINESMLLFYSILNENDKSYQEQIMGKGFKPSENDYKNNNYMIVYGGKYITDKMSDSKKIIEFSKNALEINNTCKWAYFNICEYSLKLNDVDTAKTYFEKLAMIDSDSISHWLGVAICDKYLAKNNNKVVKDFAILMLSKNKNVGWVYKVLSQVNNRENDNDNAVKNAVKAFELSPQNKWTAINLINILIKNKKYELLEKLLKEQMQHFVEFDWYNYHLAFVLFENKDFGSAKIAFDKIKTETSSDDYLKLKEKLENIMKKIGA